MHWNVCDAKTLGKEHATNSHIRYESIVDYIIR